MSHSDILKLTDDNNDDSDDNNEKDLVINIGSQSEYHYIHSNFSEKHHRYVTVLVTQMCRDILNLIYSHRANLESDFLSRIKFKCECDDYQIRFHKNNIYDDRMKNHHACVKGPVFHLRDIVDKLIEYHKLAIMIELFTIDFLSESTNKANTKNNGNSHTETTWYNYVHNCLDEVDESIREKSIIHIAIDSLIKKMLDDLIVSQNLTGPILLKCDPIEGYYPDMIINESAHTVVIKAHKDDKYVAIKIGYADKTGKILLQKEKEMLDRLPTPLQNIPKVLDAFEFPSIGIERNHNCLVFDLYGKDLYDKLFRSNDYYGKGFGLERVRIIAFQLVSGIRQLHGKNIVHNDIKLENILFRNSDIDMEYVFKKDMSDLDIVLIDLGLSIDSNTGSSELQGTLSYLSPEEIEGQSGSLATDVWSLGVVILELITGMGMFGDDIFENMVIIELITGYKFLEPVEIKNDAYSIKNDTYSEEDSDDFMDAYNMFREDFLSQERYDPRGVKYDEYYIPYSAGDEHLADFLMGCMTANPKERYTIDQLYFHPFLKSIIDKK